MWTIDLVILTRSSYATKHSPNVILVIHSFVSYLPHQSLWFTQYDLSAPSVLILELIFYASHEVDSLVSSSVLTPSFNISTSSSSD